MRILHVITRRELRGAEVVARDLCVELSQRGHDVGLVGLFQPPNRQDAEALTAALKHVEDLGGPQHRGFSLSLAWKLRQATHRFQPDVIQANAFNALKFAAAVKLTSRSRWPLVYRNVGLASKWVTRRGQRTWGRFLLRQVDQVLSVSEASRDDFADTYAVPRSRIRVTRQGVAIPPIEQRAASRARLAELIGCELDCPILIHVGNFSPEKNHQGLLNAFERIVADHRRSHLVLIGDGPLRAEIQARAGSLQPSGCVHLLGTRPDAAVLVAGADLLLLASHVEGIPGVVLEACAAAVPVVATRVGGLPEIIDDGRTGVLVPAADMQQLACQASRLIGTPVTRERLGQAAREFVQSHYDLASSVDELEELYRMLVERRARRAGRKVGAEI